MEKLGQHLNRIDGKGYKAYKDIKGKYDFPGYTLIIDHVQGDPFAAPSRIRVCVDRKTSALPREATINPIRNIATCDFLTRQFCKNARAISRGDRGIGKSGEITMDRPVQEVFQRTSMHIDETRVEARFFMGLPAQGRKISARDAKAMFFEELPEIVEASLFMDNLDRDTILKHAETAEDADFLRRRLKDLGLVSFVADGSSLPRASGIDPSPMDREETVPFTSPARFRMEIDLPNRGRISGMGVPRGVTLIVGGGYHGKSTLLEAMELGVYNHIPGDGRELAVTVADAVKIRAADGRSIVQTDISPFINNLPLKRDTRCFSTGNASGSTSQAASISEAMESGATLLLLDEDTSATNFMIRDHRMQKLVSSEIEPITPFIDKVGQLYREKGVSTILVMGGSGDYFSVADHVIRMTEYKPYDATEDAREIAKNIVDGRVFEGGGKFGETRRRIPLKSGFNPLRGGREKIGAARTREIIFGKENVDLWDLEQITEISQTRSLSHAMKYAIKFMDDERDLSVVADLLLRDIQKKGLGVLTPFLSGDLAAFRKFEFMAAVNRMRSLKIKQVAPADF